MKNNQYGLLGWPFASCLCVRGFSRVSSINDVKMAPGYWPLRCVLSHSKLGSSAQILPVPNSNVYMSSRFQYSPSEPIFSYLATSCFYTLWNCPHHLLAVGKRTFGLEKMANPCCPLQLSDQELPHFEAERHHLDDSALAGDFLAFFPLGDESIPLSLECPLAWSTFPVL